MKVKKQWITSEQLFEAISEQLANKRMASFTVTGMSMWPLLCHGRDQVIVEAIDPLCVKLGDIVLIRVDKRKYLLHRVTKSMPNAIETTGDGNLFHDGLFPRSYIIARVSKLIRNGREMDCSRFYLRIAARVWMLLFPFRRHIFNAWARIRRGDR